MTHRISQSPPQLAAPAWFRYGIIAIAALIMCSCSAVVPVASLPVAASNSPASTGIDAGSTAPARDGRQTSTLVIKSDEAPTAVTGRPTGVQKVVHEIPTHLTRQQIAQSTCPPPDFDMAACNSGCACCGGCGLDVQGPRDEYLCDGGDYGLPAAVVRSGEIKGLEPEDAIAHYDTIDGRTVVTPSNKVCIYAPRFAAVREVIDVRAYARIDAPRGARQLMPPVGIHDPLKPGTTLAEIEPNIHRAKEPPSLLRERLHPGDVGRQQRLAAAIGTLAPYCNIEVVRSGEVVGVDIAKIARSSLAAITWSGVQAPQVLIDNRAAKTDVSVQTPGTIYLLVEPNNPKLRLIKLASTDTALPGEEVEFTLRYDNVGDRVIGNVTIVDHLTTRLEYVPDTQKSTRKADFSAVSNVGESLTLKWEIEEPLQPGQGGVIQFRTKVR